MRSWENFQPFLLFFMPTPTFPLSNRTIQVSVDGIHIDSRTFSKSSFFRVWFVSLLEVEHMLKMFLSQIGLAAVSKS